MEKDIKMEKIINTVSHALSFVVVFCVTAYLYFSYKGFAYVDGKIVLMEQKAVAAEMNGIATVLPKNIAINASQRYALGSISAPLTMYEYSSLGCPHCADFHLDTETKLIEEYVNKGLLRIIFVNFPLDKKSMSAAMLSECMTYENYFGFLNELFSRQRFWWMEQGDETLMQYAANYGLSYNEAKACINNDAMAQEIIANRQEALKRLHMEGTPAFYITGADGNEIIYGVRNFAAFKQYLDSRLLRLQ